MRMLPTLVAAMIAGISVGPKASAEAIASKHTSFSEERHHLRADLLRRQSVERARSPLVPKALICQDYPAVETGKYAVVSDQIARLGAIVRADSPID